MGIKEAVVPTGTASGATDRDFDLKKLKDVLDRCGIVVTERKPSMFFRTIAATKTYMTRLGEFVAKTVEEDLTRLLASPTIGAGIAEGPTVIRTQHSQFILLQPTQFSNSTTQLAHRTFRCCRADYLS